MALHNDLGTAGEQAAQRYLMYLGLQLLEINWHSMDGYELDIIASDRRHLRIIEVKSRLEYNVQEGREAVDREKMIRMIHAGSLFARRTRCQLPLHFDVIEAIYCPASDIFEMHYYPDYFEGNDLITI